MAGKRPVACAWFGAGGEAVLQVRRVGFKGRDSPLIDGSEISLRVAQSGDTGCMAMEGLNALEEPRARGMQRESASISLAKIAGTTPHILQLPL